MTKTRTPGTRAIARALNDPAFKARLLADPTATLKEAGVVIPEGTKVVHVVLRDSASQNNSPGLVSCSGDASGNARSQKVNQQTPR